MREWRDVSVNKCRSPSVLRPTRALNVFAGVSLVVFIVSSIPVTAFMPYIHCGITGVALSSPALVRTTSTGALRFSRDAIRCSSANDLAQGGALTDESLLLG